MHKIIEEMFLSPGEAHAEKDLDSIDPEFLLRKRCK